MENAFIGVADSVAAGGSATAPGAHSAFATTGTLPAGKYRVKIRWALTATAETQLNNLEVNANASTVFSGLPTLSGTGWAEMEFDITMNGSSTFSLRSTAAATAGAVYTGQITATRLA